MLQGIALVFNVTGESQHDNLDAMEKWLAHIREVMHMDGVSALDFGTLMHVHVLTQEHPGIPFVIIGTKADSPVRAETIDQGHRLAVACGVPFFLTSASTGSNVLEVTHCVYRSLLPARLSVLAQRTWRAC